jgi:modulator of drug activity B
MLRIQHLQWKEFFQQKSVDEGVLFGFHRMNAFTGLTHIGSFHFHDMEKNATVERVNKYETEYKEYVQNVFKRKMHSSELRTEVKIRS